MEKIVIIGSSDSHNYDSHTVELTKAASARRGVHADRRPALNRRPSRIRQKTKPHSSPFQTDTGAAGGRPAHFTQQGNN